MSVAKRRGKISSRRNRRQPKTGIILTPKGKHRLEKMAREQGLSKSALVEHLVRGEIELTSSEAETTIEVKEKGEAPPQQLQEQTVALQTYQSLQQQSAAQETQLKQFEERLASKDQEIRELQQQLTEKARENEQQQATQESKLEQEQEGYRVLEEKSASQQKQIEDLERELTRLQAENEQSIPPETPTDVVPTSPEERNRLNRYLNWIILGFLFLVFVGTAVILIRYYYFHTSILNV